MRPQQTRPAMWSILLGAILRFSLIGSSVVTVCGKPMPLRGVVSGRACGGGEVFEAEVGYFF